MKFISCLTSFLLCCFVFAENDQSRLGTIEKNRVAVASFDDGGNLLHSGVGFLLDDSTLICGYSTVKGASSIKLEADDSHSYSTRLVSYNDLYNFAILKTEEEDMEASQLAGSDTLAVGDHVYFFQRDQGKWQLSESVVKGWTDSGQGYEMIRLQNVSQSAAAKKERQPSHEPSPLYNESSKIIGWRYEESLALPLKALAGYLEEPGSSIPLANISDTANVWEEQRVQEIRLPAGPFECCKMMRVEGTRQFPFQIQVPEQWTSQTFPQGKRYLLRAKNDDFAICLELRVMPQDTNDLPSAVERAETLIFSRMPRSELVPFSTDRVSGLKAVYEDSNLEKGFSRIVFYTMSKSLFYILSISYPQKHTEEIQPAIEMIFASFQT
jgi:hypothetical protein